MRSGFLAEGIEEISACPILLQLPAVEALRPSVRDDGDKGREVIKGPHSLYGELGCRERALQHPPVVFADVVPSGHFGDQAEGIHEEFNDRPQAPIVRRAHDEQPARLQDPTKLSEDLRDALGGHMFEDLHAKDFVEGIVGERKLLYRTLDVSSLTPAMGEGKPAMVVVTADD